MSLTKTCVSITADGFGEYELDLTREELEGIRKLALACERKREEADNIYLPAIEIESGAAVEPPTLPSWTPGIAKEGDIVRMLDGNEYRLGPRITACQHLRQEHAIVPPGGLQPITCLDCGANLTRFPEN